MIKGTWRYEKPALFNLSGDLDEAWGADCGTGSKATYNCQSGNAADRICKPTGTAADCSNYTTGACYTGTSVAGGCLPGATASYRCETGTSVNETKCCNYGNGPGTCSSGGGK